MATFPIPINRIGGGGYVTDVDPWGRIIASNLPPAHVLHQELEQFHERLQTLKSERGDLIDKNRELKLKVGELRTRLRKEVPAETRPTHTSLYEKLDSAISTADANILRAILREVCRVSDKSATIAASILSLPPSPVEERSDVTTASSSRTTGSRKSSVRFQEPPVSASSGHPTSARRTSARFQQPPGFSTADRTTESNELHIPRRRKERTADVEQHADASKAEFTTPRRTKRRAEEAEAEESGSRKRRSTAPLICTNCNKEYNTSENTRGSCKKHSGHKEIDDNWDHVWCDWDEDVHGQREAYIKDPDFAEGFVWSCCGEYSNVKRCTTSKHSIK